MTSDRIQPGAASVAVTVVVLTLRAQRGTVEAVRSILDQAPRADLVVVNSGGGGMEKVLAAAGINVPVVERAEPLRAGAARNLGIAATSAPFIAFLAADCRAAPGWIEGRVRAHASGPAAVGSALLPSRGSVVAWASHIFTFASRLPGLSPADALPYGASYARSLFAERGPFREDLVAGEDTEFHTRLLPDEKPVWHPEIRTIHETPGNLIAVLADQYGRGKRQAEVWRSLAILPEFQGLGLWYHRIRYAVRMSRRARRVERLGPVRLAWLLLPLLSTAFCLGVRRQERISAAPSW